jgi:hypothetical protein
MNTAKSFFAASFAVLSVTLVGVGCASPASDDESGTTDAALSSCSADQYDAALVHYKNAVAWSKDRIEHGVCETENGYLMTIADEASKAVTTCGGFRDTIRTSPWAAPLRQALGASLTLRSLTGELLVIKDSQFQNWNGTETLLSRGVTFWAEGEGAYGPPYQIDLRANGDATWGFLDLDDKTQNISWKTVPAHYTLTKADGTVTGKRILHVTHGDVTESFTLGVEDGAGIYQAPIFTLSPASGTQPTQKKLLSIVAECDA